MEKTLKLYTYIYDENTELWTTSVFPSVKDPIALSSFQYDAKRMGGAPIITATLKYKDCLDDLWTGKEYVEFNGEKYTIKQTPTSSYSNAEARYIHECEFVSERIVLDNLYFFDVVSYSTDEEDTDALSAKSSKFSFYGDINELAKRLNLSFSNAGLDYKVIVDEGITSESKLVTIENKLLSEAIQEAYNTFETTYYYVGKEIHFGLQSEIVEDVFKYGVDDALLSITKTNANAKKITKITGRGSSENIPWYYPDKTSRGIVSIKGTAVDAGGIEIENMNRFISKISVDGRIEGRQGAVTGVSIPDVCSAKIKVITDEIANWDTKGKPVNFPTKKISKDNEKYFGEKVNETTGEGNANKYFAVVVQTIPFDVTTEGRVKIQVPYIEYEYLPLKNTCSKIEFGHWFFNKDKSEWEFIKVSENYEYVDNSGGWSEIDLGYLTNSKTTTWDENGSEISVFKHYMLRLTFILESGLASATLEFKYDYNIETYPYWWYVQGSRVISDLTTVGLTHVDPTKVTDWYIQQTATGLNASLTQDSLMPYVYRETSGEERFYYAENGVHLLPNSTTESYEFENEYKEDLKSEYIQDFTDIKPTIENVKYNNQRIDVFEDIEFDRDDNDAADEAGNYVHPFFFVKLRPLGFNLFDSSIENGEMYLSATTGHCGACKWTIMVDADSYKNLVQVDVNGNLLRDESGDVICGRKGESLTPIEELQNTTQNSVWIALKKDIETFGVPMPNVGRGFAPTTDDNFVLTNIYLPEQYIIAAEKKLGEELVKFMYENNVEKFNFSIKFSRIFFAQNPDLLSYFDENVRLRVQYNGKIYEQYVSSFSYKMDENNVLPEITVDLTETVAVQQNSIQAIVNAISGTQTTSGSRLVSGISRTVSSSGASQNSVNGYYLRRDTDDTASGNITFKKNISVTGNVTAANATLDSLSSEKTETEEVKVKQKFVFGDFVQNASGAALLLEEGGSSYLEVDKLKVRMKAYFEELEIQKVNTVGGKLIISPAGSFTCVGVITSEDLHDIYGAIEQKPDIMFYRCYFQNEQEGTVIENRWKVGDQAYCQSFSVNSKTSEKGISNKYYWRLVVGVGENYIDLCSVVADTDSDVPEAGDVICQLGNRGIENVVEEDKGRQNAIVFSSVDAFSPSIVLYNGINSFSLNKINMVEFGVNQTTNKAFFNVYGDAYIGTREDENSSYMKYTEDGLEIKGKLIVKSKEKTVEDLIAEATPEDYEEFKDAVEKAQSDIDGLQKQIDGAIETWFYEGEPTLENEPAKNWDTDELKNIHLGDLYYDGETGKAYRFQMEGSDYVWNLITDTDIQAALDAAKKAQDTADGKRKVFTEQPTPPYDEGDLWVNATYGTKYSNDILRCNNSKSQGEEFSIDDWELASKYTDDSYAKERYEELTKDLEEVGGTLKEQETQITQLNSHLQDFMSDGVIDVSEREAIKISIDAIDAQYLAVEKEYNDVRENELLKDSTEKTTLDNAFTSYSTAYSELNSAIEDIIDESDPSITATERATYNNAYDNYKDKYSALAYAISKCNTYVQTLLNSNINKLYEDITENYGYIKEALKGATVTDGGLILTSLISLGKFEENETTGALESFTPQSGISGLYDKASTGGGIAFWAGGQALDLFSLKKDADGEYIIGENQDPAEFLVRMDGTGYAAGGNLWWESDGRLHADPLSFFVGEDQVGALLASFQIYYKDNSNTDNDEISYLHPQHPFDILEITSNLTISNGGYIQIGNGVLKYNSDKNAFYVENFDGTPVNFYATGGVSALGMGEDGSSTAGGILEEILSSESLGGTFDDADFTKTFNAYAINEIYEKTEELQEQIDGLELESSTRNDDKTFYHEQGTASKTWVITHNLGKYPSVTVMDSAKTVVHGDVAYDSINQVTLTFSAEFSGYATLN